MKFFRQLTITALLVTVCLCAAVLAATEIDVAAPADLPGSEPKAFGLVGECQELALATALQGTWVANVGKQELSLVLHAGSLFSLNGKRGNYRAKGKKLVLGYAEGEVVYDFDVTSTDPFSPLALTLSGGDLAQPLKFLAQRGKIEPAVSLQNVFRFSSQKVILKLQSLAGVIIIVLVARLIISALRLFSQFVIYSDRGPLKYIYRSRKNRTMTIHSLILNIVKYVVYFSALGRILNELGVNYTAYLASLSVVGLAIGFGSQGLVQDIVTGFFVVFEGQFDVGDMVEISGQTGIVEELGLRMTRLRNYLGQSVTIPNRNIALVGTYSKGSMSVHIDVAVGGADDADKVKPVLTALAQDISKQFRGVVLVEQRVSGPISFKSGEHLVRLEIGIWPQQQWVVDQQFIPRLREMLKGNGIEIPGDRIVAFYHQPKQRSVRGRRQTEKPDAGAEDQPRSL